MCCYVAPLSVNVRSSSCANASEVNSTLTSFGFVGPETDDIARSVSRISKTGNRSSAAGVYKQELELQLLP